MPKENLTSKGMTLPSGRAGELYFTHFRNEKPPIMITYSKSQSVAQSTESSALFSQGKPTCANFSASRPHALVFIDDPEDAMFVRVSSLSETSVSQVRRFRIFNMNRQAVSWSLDAHLVEAQGFSLSTHRGQLPALPVQDPASAPSDPPYVDVCATFVVRGLPRTT